MNWIMEIVKPLTWDVVSEYVFFETTPHSFKYLLAGRFLHESSNSTEGSDSVCLATTVSPAASQVSGM